MSSRKFVGIALLLVPVGITGYLTLRPKKMKSPDIDFGEIIRKADHYASFVLPSNLTVTKVSRAAKPNETQAMLNNLKNKYFKPVKFTTAKTANSIKMTRASSHHS